jgi:hypothetical protein
LVDSLAVFFRPFSVTGAVVVIDDTIIRLPRCVGLKRLTPPKSAQRAAPPSFTTVWTDAFIALPVCQFVNDVVVLIASIRPDLLTAVLLRVAESHQSKKVFASRSSICAAEG